MSFVFIWICCFVGVFFLDQGPSKPVEKPCSFCSLYFVKPSVSIFILFSGVHRYQSEQIAERVAIYSAVITRRNWMSYRLFNCLQRSSCRHWQDTYTWQGYHWYLLVQPSLTSWAAPGPGTLTLLCSAAGQCKLVI